MPIYTADAAQESITPKGLRVGLVSVSGVYAAPSTQSTTIGTTILMVKVPAGATPVFMQYGTSQPGDHTLSIGDGNNNARFKTDATLTAGQGMIVANVVASPYTYSVDDTIDMFISLVSESSLGGSWFLNVIFSMDNSPH